MMPMIAILSAGMLAAAPTTADKPLPQPLSDVVSVRLDFAGFSDAGDTRLAIDAGSMSKLNRARRAVVRIALSPIETVSLDLQRFEVIAPDAKFVRATADARQIVAAPHIVCLRGEVAGEPLSHAFLALNLDDAGSGLGLITRPGGERWHIGTDRSAAQPAMVIRRGNGDVPDFEHFCTEIVLDQPPPEDTRGLPPNAAAGPRVLNVAVETDQKYWQLFGNDAAALAYIPMVLAAVSDIYLRDLDFRIALRFARIWPLGGEPVSASDLGGFRTYWQANEDMTGLNLVHMFSGRRDTSYGGVAYISDACTQDAFGISAFLLGGFPAPVVAPNLGNWDVNVVAHEMGHNLGTFHTHDYTPPIDTCASGSNQRGTIMSYCHTRPGGLLNIDMRMHAKMMDVIAEANPETPSCLWHDCNGNLINDTSDIASGFSADLNRDGIPDECQDCNGNGILDTLEIAAGDVADVNGNGVPDSCENDCNGNGIPDRYECSQNPAIDLDGNRIPDSCEPDCDGNGIADFLDIANGTYTDLDRNSRPDVCDDCNTNGIVDWIDLGREFNPVVAQASAQNNGNPITSPLREYLAASGVLVQAPALGSIDVMDVAFGADRQAYLASFNDHRIVRVNLDSGSANNFVAPATGGLQNPSGLCFGPDGNLYVASQGNSKILRYNASTGAFLNVFVPAGSGGLAQPWDLLFGPNGNLFVLSGAAGVLQYNGSTGAFIGVFAAPTNLNQPRGICFLPGGDLLVTNHGNSTIRRFSAGGVDLGRWNDEFAIQGPWGLTMGPRGHAYLGQAGNPVRIVEYTTAGRYIRSYIRGDNDLIAATSLAFRPPASGDINGNLVLDTCESVCLGDIAPQPSGNHHVDVDDLLAIILHWGVCPAMGDCPADVVPPGGNGQVNVDDLLAVILHWGACP